MELNKRKTEKTLETVQNPEGAEVYSRDPKIQLYLEASNLKIKSDQFYEKANDKLDTFIKSVKAEKDEKYLEGLAKFLSDNGLKLSPVVISALLSNRGYSFRGKRFEKIFNTPQRIAEAISLGKKYHLNNSFKQNTLKAALENMNQYTLRKNKLENRSVKTRDLIKLLRPKPKSEDMAKLYKAIIEGTKLSRLKAEESLVAMKSSDKDEKVKTDYLKENLEKVPLNELIRNLKFITEKYRYTEQKELYDRVIKRLNSVDDLKYLNIFDLIETSLAVPELQKPLFEVVVNFVEKVKAKNKMDFGKGTVLFDISGSMQGQGEHNGFKYLVLFALLYKDIHVRYFDTDLRSKDKEIISEIRKGNLITAKKRIHVAGGTSLVQCMNSLMDDETEMDEVIVISDEVSWSEGNDLKYMMNQMNQRLKKKKVILINPAVYKGTVFTGNVVGIASLTSTILLDIALFTKPKAFIEYVRQYDFEDRVQVIEKPEPKKVSRKK